MVGGFLWQLTGELGMKNRWWAFWAAIGTLCLGSQVSRAMTDRDDSEAIRVTAVRAAEQIEPTLKEYSQFVSEFENDMIQSFNRKINVDDAVVQEACDTKKLFNASTISFVLAAPERCNYLVSGAEIALQEFADELKNSDSHYSDKRLFAANVVEIIFEEPGWFSSPSRLERVNPKDVASRKLSIVIVLNGEATKGAIDTAFSRNPYKPSSEGIGMRLSMHGK